MSKLIPFLLSCLAFTQAAFPWEGRSVDLGSSLRKADLVARVKIVSVANAPADSGFRQLARATITDAVKGMKQGENIDLLSDNGYVCPNVIYKVGDDCIVFAMRRKSGHFETMYTYAGLFRLENGAAECHLLADLDHELYRGTFKEIEAKVRHKYQAEEILAVLRRHLSTNEAVPPK